MIRFNFEFGNPIQTNITEKTWPINCNETMIVSSIRLKEWQATHFHRLKTSEHWVTLPLTTFLSPLLLLSLSFWVAPNIQDSNTYTRWWWELEHQWYTCATVQPYSNNSPIKIMMTVVRKTYFYSTTFGHINSSSPSLSKLSENSILSTVQLKPLSIHNLWLVFEVLLFEAGLSLTGLTFRSLRHPSSQWKCFAQSNSTVTLLYACSFNNTVYMFFEAKFTSQNAQVFSTYHKDATDEQNLFGCTDDMFYWNISVVTTLTEKQKRLQEVESIKEDASANYVSYMYCIICLVCKSDFILCYSWIQWWNNVWIKCNNSY